MNACIVQTTCSSKTEAKNIARVLISENLAACVQFYEVESCYMWNGEFCEDFETLLNIKTTKENFAQIQRKIKELHSYDVPEIIEISITNASKKYLKFIGDNTI